MCDLLRLQVHEQPLMLAVADMEGLLETLKVCRALSVSSSRNAASRQ